MVLNTVERLNTFELVVQEHKQKLDRGGAFDLTAEGGGWSTPTVSVLWTQVEQ